MDWTSKDANPLADLRAVTKQWSESTGLSKTSTYLLLITIAFQLDNEKLVEDLLKSFYDNKKWGYAFEQVVWATKVPSIGQDSAMEMGLDGNF